MIEKINYISDDELECLITQVEQNELVAAPPDLMESILEAVAGFSGETESLSPAKVIKVQAVARKKEFRAYCVRVITSVAAAVALVFMLPELTEGMNLSGVQMPEYVDKSAVVGTVPGRAEVVKNVPDRNTVVETKPLPSKEEVLNDTGFLEKVISNTSEWLSKESNDK